VEPTIRPIPKVARPGEAPPNLLDYEAACRGHRWEDVRGALAGLPGGRGVNMAFEAVDRHLEGALSDAVAIRFLAKDAGHEEITYAQLAARTNRFANVLAALGVRRGERVFALSARRPELYEAALGTLKYGAIFSPLFSAFGPEPVRSRLAIGEGAVVVTSTRFYEKKLAPVRAQLPSLAHVLLTDVSEDEPSIPGGRSLSRLMAEASTNFTIPETDPETPALLHFTSGTTGTPKGALHVHGAIAMHRYTGRVALDLRPGDVFWCTADPGWVTGTSYGVLAPLANGATMVVDEAELDVERWYDTLKNEKVTVWYTAPTAIRMLMKAGAAPVRVRGGLPDLRFLASVGEPLNPDAVLWSQEVFGRPFHDNWWQTETGGIMVANYASAPVRPGSMGRPLPGVKAHVVARTETGVREITEPGAEGELAIEKGWPSMFRAYWREPTRYEKCFVGALYLTGDLVRRDADGYFWFVGRADDVIKSAGHLIGPFEVESTLLDHPAVAEAAVIGKPEPIAGEIVKGFVALKPGFEASDALAAEIIGHCRKRLGPAVAPRELSFVPGVPRTKSGKILRRLLKARELGLPEGDVSTLEGGASS
jgi:acetyl-CoA synthetase